jgi:hypothetical protein
MGGLSQIAGDSWIFSFRDAGAIDRSRTLFANE